MNVIAERHEAVLTKPTSKATLPLSLISVETSYASLPWVAATRGNAISLSPVLRTAPAASLLMKLFPACCPSLVAGQTPQNHGIPLGGAGPGLRQGPCLAFTIPLGVSGCSGGPSLA